MATATPAREKKLQMANDDVINNQFENDKVQDYEWPPNVSLFFNAQNLYAEKIFSLENAG